MPRHQLANKQARIFPDIWQLIRTLPPSLPFPCQIPTYPWPSKYISRTIVVKEAEISYQLIYESFGTLSQGRNNGYNVGTNNDFIYVKRKKKHRVYVVETKYVEFYSKKKKRGLGRVGIQGFGYKGYRREGRKETKRRIEFYSIHKMNGGRRGGVKSDFIREIRHHSTTHRGGTGFLRRRGEFSYLLLLLLSVVWALRTYESKYGGSGCGASTANDSGCEWRSEWLWKHPRHQPRLPVFLL